MRTTGRLVLLYIGVYIVSLYGAELGKAFLTGTAGPNTRFLAAVGLCPAAFLALGGVVGRRAFPIHLALIAGLAAWCWVTYPAVPLMNFERQIASVLPLPLALTYLAGLAASAFRLAAVSRPV